jgi:hypothetical protein
MSIKTRFLAYEVSLPAYLLSLRYVLTVEQIYLVLIKLDFYFIAVFVVQYGLIDVHFEEPEFALTMALLPASFLMMALAFWCVLRERKIGMIMVIVSQSVL